MKILQKGQTGLGILIEEDAGFISSNITNHNEKFFNSVINESFDFKEQEPILIDCILQKWGVENRNGRIYPKEILVPQIEEYSKQVHDNSAFGELDHPTESTISLHNISHIIKEMWWGKGKDQNILYGKLEIITSPGYIKNGVVSMGGDKIIEYLKRGGKLGISSRGVGSLKEVNGKNIVQNDFELICFDLVVSPSTPGAYLYPKMNTNINNVKEHTETILSSPINEKLNLALDKFLI